MSEAAVDRLARSQQSYAEAHAWLGWSIDAAKATDKAITGTQLPSSQAYTGAVIARTAMGHAMSLIRILPKPGVGGELYDIASCAALTRSMAECYVSFRYHAIEPRTEEDRLFRERLAEHHLRAKQKRLAQGMAVTDQRWTNAVASANAARAALETDPKFLGLSDAKRQYLLAAKASMHVDGRDVVRAAGIDASVWGSLHASLSQYVHAAPLAVARAAAFDAELPAASFEMALLARLSAMLHARMLVDLATLVPGSDRFWSAKQATLVPGMAAELAGLGPRVKPEAT